MKKSFMRRLGLGGALALAVAGNVWANQWPMPTQMSCPVGGELVEYESVGFFVTLGNRPDGRPYGSYRFPLDLPECAGNALVVYKTFSTGEISRLSEIVSDPRYGALSRRETQHYRAAWLDRALEPQSDRVTWLLLQATWEADDFPEAKRRYQDEFVRAVSSRPPAPDALDWLVLQGLAANAERELGRFDAALARLQGLALGGASTA